MILKQSTAVNIPFWMADSTDSITGKTGLSPSVTLAKDGAAFGASGGSVTEIGNGWYYLSANTTDTGTLKSLVLHATATGADPWDENHQVVAVDLYDTVRFGLTALPNAAAEAAGGLYTRGSGAGQINQPANGQIDSNAVKWAGTATTLTSSLPDVNTKSLGGTTQTGRDIGASVLLSTGTGTGQLDFTSGVVKSNLAQILGTALTETSGQLAGGFKKFFNIATPASTMDALTTIGAVSGSVGSVTGNVGGSVASVTGNVGGNVVGSVASVTAGVTVTTNNDKTGYSLSAGGIQAIWDALTSALTTVNSIGKLLVTNINAAVGSIPTNPLLTSDSRLNHLDADISTRLATSGYTAPDNSNIATIVSRTDVATSTRLASSSYTAPDNTSITAIKAKTDNLPASPAATSDIPTSNITAIKAKTDNLPASPAATSDIPASDITAIKAKTDNLPSSPAASSYKKNAALTYPFQMFDSSGSPATGLSVVVKVSKDGGAMATSSNTAVEVSLGWYSIALTTTEMNAKSVALNFSATGATSYGQVLPMEG